MSVPQAIRGTLRSVAACVTGSARRSIQAWAAKTYCHGSPRHTETVFGWNRQTVASGIREAESPPAKSGTEQETQGRPSLEKTHAELGTQPNLSSTFWLTVSDRKNRVYYFQDTNNLGALWVKIDKIDLKKGSGVRKLTFVGKPDITRDQSLNFEKSEPFKFLAPH